MCGIQWAPSHRARPAKAVKAIRLILVSRAIIKDYPNIIGDSDAG
jgi:hypothetical protein